ncbi:hypothetical protein D9611_003444 [Ephemerocybe angulata]|uniref:P-loop containing nucleoside triphosphate hydrolase protein n=1 Tax=Ephemerocybe angulata TaxID=980116 RepID=A0A8H5FH10_9AGAR|nr:hypothetical protein D9611_003444 [Tulosesus angulatus]
MAVVGQLQQLFGAPNPTKFLVQLPEDVYNLTGNFASVFTKGKFNIWKDSLSYPIYASLLSALVLVAHIVASRRSVQRLIRRIRTGEWDSAEDTSYFGPPPPREATYYAELQERARKHGGAIIFAFKVARLVGCIAFLALSIYTTVIDEESRLGTNGKKKKKKKKHQDDVFSQKEWQDLAICLTNLYAVLLSLVTVGNKRRWSKTAAHHLNLLLLLFIGVYGYRDIFPYATFDRSPLDTAEGLVLWAKIFVLAVTAIVIPLTIPRQYTPLDPNNPMPEPNAEQTASLLSLMTYSFLDPVVWLANRVPHLTSDQLPPLADYDYAQNLRAQTFPHLDAFVNPNKRHLFFRLMRVFRKEYIILSIAITIQVIAGFGSPLGVRYLLRYIETDGADATIKPWVWVAWLFVGPTISSIAYQWYIFIATRTLVRAECIITQLVFEHSLRIRVKAETAPNSDSDPRSEVSTLSSPGGSDTNESISEDETLLSHSQVTEMTEATVGRVPQDDNRPETPKSIKSQASSSKSKKKSEDEPSEGTSSASNLVGKINNLVTTDLGNIVDSRDFLYMVLYTPLQIALAILFLYNILGWSAFVGLAVMLVLFPLPGYVAKRIQDVQIARLKKTDARVEVVSETMNVLRMVKMFGWEKKMNDRIAEKREEELRYVWKRQILDFHYPNWNNDSQLFDIRQLIMLILGLTVIMRRELSASIVFSSMTVFDMLRSQLHIVFFVVNQSVTGKVSLDRVDDFLKNYTAKDDPLVPLGTTSAESGKIGFHEASFTWSNDADGTLTPSKRKFVLRIEDDLQFAPNKINLVIGPTGSGKTSLLMALLGEMHYIPLTPVSCYNLPRANGIAYAAQESWVQNETIRENILFGSPYDEERYNKVIDQCGLKRDLTLFEAGDQTEVGEKGLTLSGGQKARITLARAVYSPAQILLLDDVFAALDVHTAKWIVDKCFTGDLIKGRTVILVTHNIALTKPIAEYVVSMGSDGRVLSHGPVSEALKLDKKLEKELRVDAELTKKADDEVEAHEDVNKPADGKLIVAEEVEEGHVSWSALKMFFEGLGGKHPVLFFSAFLVGLGLCDIALAVHTWFLGYWASQYQNHPASEVPVFLYLAIYGICLLVALFVWILANVTYIWGTIRASRAIHKNLVESVLGTTLRWLDTTPISRVITRCTQDIRAVDGPISSYLMYLSEMSLSMLTNFGAVVLLTPIFLIPGVFIAVVGGACGQVYIAAQLSVKREMSNAKAPVLGHFGASIAGLTSLRAYGAQEAFINESMNRINRYTRASRTFYNLNRWICIRVDAIGGLFSAGLAAYLLYLRGRSAANIGFSLNMAVGFSSQILWWIRILNDFEVAGNSLERIEKYIEIEQEPKATKDGEPPAYWPSSGNLHVEGLSARYSVDGPRVLHGIGFDVKAGERIGIVGRTGSGKSSLTLALLRCIFTEGLVLYDNIDTSKINLDALRTCITIIPQVPELLSGSLRQNLDPFDQYDDAALNDALRSAGLFSLQQDVEEGRITLDSQISSGGANLSVGQRQILALARAIIRGSKLLILDEGESTSAIDHDTDAIIQSSLRNELGSDVTVITVAHRLQTIMDADKIMVLDAGRIVEFNKPSELLKDPKGKLRALVDESGDKEHLFEMAGAVAPK